MSAAKYVRPRLSRLILLFFALAFSGASVSAQVAKCGVGEEVTYTSRSSINLDDFETGSLSNWTVGGNLDWFAEQKAAGREKFYGNFHLKGVANQNNVESTVDTRNSILMVNGSYFWFDHQYDFENGFDGGVVEYSIDGGATWADLLLASGAVVEGDTYNGQAFSVVQGVVIPAFTGSQQGYARTKVNMNFLAGESVNFRFRILSDSSISSTGWIIDNVEQFDCRSASTDEVTLINSCLAGNGRLDANIVNNTTFNSIYTVRFPGLTDRNRPVAFEDWGRIRLTGRPDGFYSVDILKDDVLVQTEFVSFNCNSFPDVSVPEVTLQNACRSNLGQVFFQLANPDDVSKPYVVEFEGVANRSTTAAAYGQSRRGTTGRPNGLYDYAIRTGREFIDYGTVLVDCEL